jgi:putative ABC transport system substrate-binding protein
VSAQQQGKVWRVGFLAGASRPASFDSSLYGAFVQAMRELGYVEGKNLVIEWRFAEGVYDRLPSLAAELLPLKVDVIVTQGNAASRAAKQATATIPIVIAITGDLVEEGFVASLAHPGGNMTGLDNVSADVFPKRLELLLAMVPRLRRVAVVFNSANAGQSSILKHVQDAARKVKVTVIPVDGRTAEEIERGFALMMRERAGGVIVLGDAFLNGQQRQIAELAVRYRLPSIFAYREMVEAGGLMSYGQDLADFFRRAAVYVGKIFKGAKPGELPIEQPMKFEMVINRKTAKAIGLAIPQELVLRADRLIE